MNAIRIVVTTSVAFVVVCLAGHVAADTFGADENTFEIEFVTIGAPGNDPDTTGTPNQVGAVPYVYRIGKYGISEDMVNKANEQGALGIGIDRRDSTNKPATSVNWFEAATFVNWLNTSSGHEPAYKFNEGVFELWQPEDSGYDAANPYRNTAAFYFLPSIDEYYKAAYYDPVENVYYDFPTGSNDEPMAVTSGTDPETAVFSVAAAGPAEITQAGGLSSFGTMSQGGNVWEWEETAGDLSNSDPDEPRGGRGGSWQGSVAGLAGSFRLDQNTPTTEFSDLSFRVASVPEPGAHTIVLLGLLSLVTLRRRRRTEHRSRQLQ